MLERVFQNAEPIPGYKLIERIGGGGFGEVWRVSAPGGMQKAIKFVFGDLSNTANSQRAEQELKALKRVQSVRHPYILTLERYDIVDGQLMIVMELADRNLWDRYKECRVGGLPGIPRDELLSYMAEIAEALDLMNHDYGLQHLDIKPQNLFLVHNHVKVADFGLVKDLENSHASITGGLTPVYAAPETFDGKVTRFSDQYSLAIVYQELLTGQRPFSGNNVRQLILQHLQGVPNVTPLPEADQPAIRRALAKSPNERFPTCRELVQVLLSSGKPAEAISPSALDLLAGSATGRMGQDLVDQRTSYRLSPGETGIGNPASAAEETPASGGVTQNIRGVVPSILVPKGQTGTRAPQEVAGTGTLFPAVVIGLGQLGLNVLEKCREFMRAGGCPSEQLSCVRFLQLDSDPEITRSGTGAGALNAPEFLIAPLGRPSHYLKPRQDRPNLESWVNPRMVYRIPRSQVTTGVRALGRLAFFDNYRSILRRLQSELEAVLDPVALETSEEKTKLGVRTNRPRVYVVTSLGGGTGGGMFLDVAYNIRELLRQMGYENPDVVSILLLPRVDGNRTRLLSLGNAYAALAELKHYASRDTVFSGKYHDREPAISDSGPPFSRTIVVPLPDETDETATQRVAQLCGQYLYRDLVTPFGKAADLGRAGLPAPPWEERGQYVQTFGMFQLSWPRHALMQSLAREMCRRVVLHWANKDSKPIRQEVQDFVEEQWNLLELGSESFIHAIQVALIKTFGRPVESLFTDVLAPLKAGDSEAAPGRAARGKTAPLRFKPEQLKEVLCAIEQLVGSPEEIGQSSDEPPRLLRTVREITESIAGEWCQKLVELPVKLIENPVFRLAGAEEAIRVLVANVERALQHHEPLARDLAEKAQDAHDHLRVAAGRPARAGSRLTPKNSEQIVALCQEYCKQRLQWMVLTNLATAFVACRGHLSDELREVGFCRTRLTELYRLLDEAPEMTGVKEGTRGIARVLFVSGCKNLDEAVKRAAETISPDQLLELDGDMERMLREQFTALVHVCLAPQSVLKPLEKAMMKTAVEFVSKRTPASSVAKLFFEKHQDTEDIRREVMSLYQQAEPELTTNTAKKGVRPAIGLAELNVLVAPTDEDCTQFVNLVKQNLCEVEWHTTTALDDIVLYRERVNVNLTDLEQMGPLGHEAYAQLNGNENFTLHARCDVQFSKQ